MIGLSHKLAELFAAENPGETWIETVTFSHPNFAVNPRRFTSWPTTVTAMLETGAAADFLWAPFEVGLPSRDGEVRSELAIAFGGVDLTTFEEIDRALAMPSIPISATYRIYAESSLNVGPDLALQFAITQARMPGRSLQLIASKADLLNRQFPNQYFTTTAFPGLDR